jgi:membrane carboxypeptidase/penicillin-binding protein
MRKRRKDSRRGLRNLARAVSILLVFLSLMLGLVGLGISISYAELQVGLPAVEELENILVSTAGGFPAVTLLYDRTGENVIQELLHPLAEERIWFRLPSDSDADAYQWIVTATLASQDVSYWSNPGFQPSHVLQTLRDSYVGNAAEIGGETISQQLVQNLLQPVQDVSIHPLARYLRSVLLASRLTETYSKEQILEWYLNTAHYGNLAYGIDAAALVYFGVHASDLSLAQVAMLAPISQTPERNPIDAPDEARSSQIETLGEMTRLGFIGESESHQAMAASLDQRGSEEVRSGLQTSGFNAYAWSQMVSIMGDEFMHRPGLRVRTSLDLPMQLQADCTLRTHLARMAGGSPARVQAALDGAECVAAVYLPPLRPGDIGVDHNISDISAVIMDPFSGEILSLVDTQGTFSLQRSQVLAADWERELGSAFNPFIYLTAFSRGFAPGTMVLDLPLEISSAPGSDPQQSPIDWSEFRGPVSMRTALVGSYEAAAARTIDLVGVGNVLRTAQQMGITSVGAQQVDYELMLSQGEAKASLIDLTFAYSLMANNGSMVGVDLAGEAEVAGSRTLEPLAILLIEDASGNEIYQAVPEARAVLSPQLAYLMADVLSDEVVRWEIFGQSNPLEIGRPAGTIIGTTPASSDNWAVGFTPSHVIGVWVGNVSESMVGVGALNGGVPLWHALMSHATQNLPLQGWSPPPGMSEMDVCYPSGLLPTLYCPDVVREVFIQGTEPSSYDHLYRPYRVNKETGKLATLFTPLELVEERVYMVPPPEALEWAQQVGIEQPPQEYDSIYVQPEIDPAVNLTSLEPFAYASGELLIEGSANPEGFVYYRLQYGAGINPTRWVQIGENIDELVQDGVLGVWDTTGLNGLHTLQLVVVREGDRVDTAAVPLTIDNLPPLLQLTDPQPGQQFSRSQNDQVMIQVQASDETGLAQLAYYVDGRRIEVIEAPPFTAAWTITGGREHTLFVRAYDLAGNSTQSETVTIEVIP